MAKAKTKTLPPGVVGTLRDLAAAALVSTKTVSEWRSRPGFPVEADGTYDVWAVSVWWHKQQALASKSRAVPIPSEMDGGEGDSPWLERYREARTHRENLKLETERRNLLPRELVHDTLMQMASIIRGVGETLQRQFGEGAYSLLETRLDEADSLISVIFGDDSDADIGALETPETDAD